ncbi:MAG: RluA family pseudouridine synthase [Alphaproteobacteria bacterium]|nr:RluA family pseudouridine synthase [Alphaproteobacteria bacterium]
MNRSSLLSLTLNEIPEGRFDAFLASQIEGKSRSFIQKLIQEGYLLVDGQPYTHVRHFPEIGSEITLSEPEPIETKATPQNIPLTIYFEDKDVIVFEKPAGLVVHAGAGSHEHTLVNALLHHCKGQLSAINGVMRPGIVHRLDKETSGIMIAAKSDRAYHSLRKQFDDHSITRQYLGFVWNMPLQLEGTIEKPLGRHAHHRQKMTIKTGGKPARTDYEVLETFENNKISLVEFTLHTGRTHQIRVHMQNLGCPIIGDKVYGKDARMLETIKNSEAKEIIKNLSRHQLHAEHLGFIHPVSEQEMSFDSDLPEDMQELYENIS